MTRKDHEAVAAAVGVPDFMTIDTRCAPVLIRRHYCRSWIRQGFTLAPGPPVDPLDGYVVATALEAMPECPLAVISTARDPVWSAFSERIAAEFGASRVMQIVDRNGVLHWNAVPLDDGQALDRTRATRLRITASNEYVLRDVDLPAEVAFSLPGPGSAPNLLRVEASSPYESERVRLPPPTWLRFSGAPGAAGKLRIDVVPGDGYDHWHFDTDPPDIEAVQVPEPGCPDILSRVAIVFDRTCPDAARWHDALRLAQQVHEAPDQFPSFNEGIRQGTRQALQRADWPAEVRWCVTWFADVPGDGVAQLKGVPPTGSEVGPPLVFDTIEALADAFDTMTYRPGLDVWDPVEKALAETLPLFETGEGGTVIIVGNSPPTYPGPDSPLAVVAAAFGFETGHRTHSDVWHEALERLGGMGVPVFYVFLRHPAAAGHHMADGEAFLTLQSLVEHGLSQCLPGRVIAVNATPESVEAGIRRALAKARSAETCHSGMELRDAG